MLESGDAQAFDEIKKATEELDKSDMGRIAEKVLWYGKKIHELESDAAFQRLQAKIGQDRTFAASRFANCQEAYDLWKAIQYLLRQYGKMLANLVCMELLLLKVDEKLVRPDIGVAGESVIKQGVASHARPAHMKVIDD